MRCPKCHHHKTETLDSRPRADNAERYRRRRCPECSHRFSTTEVQLVSVTDKGLIEDRINTHIRVMQARLLHDVLKVVDGGKLYD